MQQNDVQLNISVRDGASQTLARVTKQLKALQGAVSQVTASSQRLTDASGRINSAFQTQRQRVNTLVRVTETYEDNLRDVQRATENVQKSSESQTKETVDAATRQIKALGDLSQLTFDYHDKAEQGIVRLQQRQQDYIQTVHQTASAFSQLSSSFAQLANTGNKTVDGILNGLSAVSGAAVTVANLYGAATKEGSGFGFGRNSGRPRGSPRATFGSTISDASSFLQTVLQFVRLFHDPANDRLAELAGARRDEVFR